MLKFLIFPAGGEETTVWAVICKLLKHGLYVTKVFVEELFAKK